MAYSETVMDHFTNPRNAGELPDATGMGEAGNPRCGDVMRMYIKVTNDRVEDIRFMTFGCGAAVACGSMATQLIKGLPLQEALQVDNRTVVQALGGLPPVKLHCSVLAEQTFRRAVADHYRRRGLCPPFSEEDPPACCDLGCSD